MRLAILLVAAAASTLQMPDAPHPTCRGCSATYIANEELQAYFNRATAAVNDQQVRAVDIGKSNVDVGVVYRGRISGTPNAAEHDQVSEVYHVIDGSATLV